MVGFSNEFKDSRVNKMLDRKGYVGTNIFYSPIKIWLFFSFLIIGMTLPLIFQLIHKLDVKIIFYIISYGSIAYLVAAFLNNSFALNGESFFVVNPNHPFKRLRKFPLEEIQQIEIGKNNWFYTAIMFGTLGNNYVEIRFENRIERYYCVGLEIDSFDENQTKLTIDDLYAELRNNRIPTVLSIR